jgi:biopolymer transport protein ExbD
MNLATRKRRLLQGELWCSLDASGPIFVFVFFFVWLILAVLPPTHSNSSIDLALTTHPVYMSGADKENAIHIGILRDGSIYCEQDKVSAEQIAPRLRDKIRTGSERKAYIKVDKRAKYGSVADVINAVSDAGISDVGFLTYQRKAPEQPEQ